MATEVPIEAHVMPTGIGAFDTIGTGSTFTLKLPRAG
jgi:hypothetical protein